MRLSGSDAIQNRSNPSSLTIGRTQCKLLRKCRKYRWQTERAKTFLGIGNSSVPPSDLESAAALNEKGATVDVRSVILNGTTEALPSSVHSLDHCAHIVQTALSGHPDLAADHLLNKEMKESLERTIGNAIRQLNLEFVKCALNSDDPIDTGISKVKARQRAYEVLIEIALNLFGMEKRLVPFADEEVENSLRVIKSCLECWEALEKTEATSQRIAPVARAVVEKLIHDMRNVMGGSGMVAKMGDDVESSLKGDNLMGGLLDALKSVIQKNVYYRMAALGMCKFGNDYALGLRWLRHLGYVQVSTNPVLAARAYDDDPTLWNRFKQEASKHLEWFDSPEALGDDLAMEATKMALWPNLVAFRPIAILSNFHDGVVSYQLNPNVAGGLKESVSDALKIYSSAQEFLRKYDESLMWGYSNIVERGRPNIVFKVAGGYSSAIEITTFLNRMGIGTNNTVTYTVAQEATLIVAAMKGMADALRMSIAITQAYETNMGGRLESHLRETEAEELLMRAIEKIDNREEVIHRLVVELVASKEVDDTADLQGKIRIICSTKYLKSLEQPTFVEVIASSGKLGKSREQAKTSLAELETAIQMAGTLVARRVYQIFFSPQNRTKWLPYLQREFSLSIKLAEEIMDKIDVLPASKRRPDDTLLTLGRKNVTNTEFPNHQQNVLEASRKQGFKLSEFEDSILNECDPKIVEKLMTLEDFRRAYEATPELNELFRKVGIKGQFGNRGIRASEWSQFGAVVKTMHEFSEAYDAFKEKAIKFVREIANKG